MVHSGEWTTSSYEIGVFSRFLAKSEEPVVHSGEWTTGARAYGYFPVKVYRLIGTGAKPILSQISLDNYSQSAILKLNNKRKEDTPQMGAGDVFQSY